MLKTMEYRQPAFLPMSRDEMDALGWDALDVLLLSGDAYVDHPSFGTALLGRWLVNHGFRTGTVAQPPWKDRAAAIKAVSAMGRPRLFAGATAGAIDSMLAHYTAFRKKRSDDAYTPGGEAGARPNRAVITYTGFLRQAFPGLPVIIGGIEASLRRISHYDFWDDGLRRSVLLDAKADILIYGMGEAALLEVAREAADIFHDTGNVERSALVNACRSVPGLVYSAPAKEVPSNQDPAFQAGNGEALLLPSHEDIQADPAQLMQATLILERQVHNGEQAVLQPSNDRMVTVNPPAASLSEASLDKLYGLPYSRLPHPSYQKPIPAWEMIRTSITTHRGCGGGCSFCSLALHQGRRIASRSEGSILNETAHIAKGPKGAKAPPRWAGSISDVGGPSANMWRARCAREGMPCLRESCMHPKVCRHFLVNQMEGVRLLRRVASTPGIRHVRVASGVRFDLALRDREALFGYTSEFTGGQLKVAPEHACPEVLALMRKPGLSVFEEFLRVFFSDSGQAGKEQYTVPYLMSAFPGCTMEHMRELKRWLASRNWNPQQVQCFIPTPGTVATAMFYAGIDQNGKPLHVARSDKERMEQHHVLFAGEGRKETGRRPRTGPPRSSSAPGKPEGGKARKRRR